MDAKEKLDKALDKLKASKVGFMVRPNNSESSSVPNHITVMGEARTVEYYPTKDTFYSNGVKGKFKAKRGVGLIDAIKLAKNG